MYDKAITIIQDFMDARLFAPKKDWPRYEFVTRSHERWAADELIRRISEESMRLPEFISGREARTPVEIIGGFVKEMDYYSQKSTNKDTQHMFSVARDTATEIIYLFL